MKVIIIKEYQATETRKWPVGQFAEVTPEVGATLIEEGFAKEANNLGYDKNGQVVETRAGRKKSRNEGI
jgi:hypothetical protein